MNHLIDLAHERLGKEFLHKKFHFFKDHNQPDDSPEFPTREEFEKGLPAGCGWTSGLEDGALNGGMYLEGQSWGYKSTGDKKYLERGRVVLDGIINLCTCGTRGFIARSVWNDGKLHYLYSSIDQYTMAVYGLWRIYFSDIPTAEQKGKIQQILSDVADKFYREKGDITADNGQPERNFTGGGPRDRFPAVERTLEMFKAAHSVSGEPRFKAYYDEWINDKSQPSVLDLMDRYEETSPVFMPYMYFQTQVALRLIFETEENPQLKAGYERTMKKLARILLPYIERFKYHAPQTLDAPEPLGWRSLYKHAATDNPWVFCNFWWFSKPRTSHEEFWVKQPLEACYVVMLSGMEIDEKTKNGIRQVLMNYPVAHCKTGHGLVYFEGAYHLAKAIHLLD